MFKNSKISLFKQLWLFAKTNGKWGLFPFFIVLALLGILMVFAQGSAFAPFIYTIF